MSALYRPRHQWQGDPADDDPLGWYDCTAFSAAMGVDAVCRGAVVPTGGMVRRLTDEPTLDPRDPGLTLGQVRAACDRFGATWVDRCGKAWASVLTDLRAKRWVVAQIWYPALGTWRAQRTGEFGHAVGLMAIDATGTRTLMYDPLARAGRWTPLEPIRAAMIEWGRRSGLPPGGLLYMASKPTIPYV